MFSPVLMVIEASRLHQGGRMFPQFLREIHSFGPSLTCAVVLVLVFWVVLESLFLCLDAGATRALVIQPDKKQDERLVFARYRPKHRLAGRWRLPNQDTGTNIGVRVGRSNLTIPLSTPGTGDPEVAASLSSLLGESKSCCSIAPSRRSAPNLAIPLPSL